MFEEIVSFESFALVCIFVALGAGMAWRQMRWAAKPVEDSRDQRKEDAKPITDKQPTREEEQIMRLIAADLYNEACNMEPFCGAGKVGGINPAMANALVGARVQQAINAYQSDAYKRRLNAGIQNQRKEEQPAEPPKTAQEAAFHDLMMYGTGIMQTSSSGETRHVPREEYFSGGGSFDGGGASGDWGGSSSSSSSSSDCSSSSSDSGGGSCGGSSD